MFDAQTHHSKGVKMVPVTCLLSNQHGKDSTGFFSQTIMAMDCFRKEVLRLMNKSYKNLFHSQPEISDCTNITCRMLILHVVTVVLYAHLILYVIMKIMILQ